jgi:hypothetical protein
LPSSKRELRTATEDELALLRHLLSVDFPGRDVLRSQLEGIASEPVTGDGVFELKPQAGTAATVNQRVPVEGEATDADGMQIVILLHVIQGWLHYLELFRADSRPLTSIPPPDAIQVLVRPPVSQRTDN